MSDKTEDPTPKRLRKAREAGDSGVSGSLAQSAAMIVAVALTPSAARALAARAGQGIRTAAASASVQTPTTAFDPQALAGTVVTLVSPLLLAAALTGVVLYVAQTGGVVATQRLRPDLDRLNPLTGLGRLFSATRVFAVVRALIAAVAVGWLAARGVADHLGALARLPGRSVRSAAVGAVVSNVAGALAWRASLLALALGLIDLVITRRGWWRRLRMSKHEIRREARESEGDPQLKAARERAYQELIAQATLANVRSAAVVVINPTHLACALRYRDGRLDPADQDEAPVVVASGEGELATRIVEAARAAGVPVVRDVPLARALIELSVGDAIPEALYEAVAEILREIWEDQASDEPTA